MAKKYCNKCKKDVTSKRGKCPECGMVFDVKLKEDAIPINVVNGEKSKEENQKLKQKLEKNKQLKEIKVRMISNYYIMKQS